VLTFDVFFDRLGDLDWLGVIVGTLVAMAVGTLWYGPLFGKVWSRAAGVTMASSPPPAKVAATAIYMFVLNVGMAWWGVADDIEYALVLGLALGILVIAPALFSAVVWAKRSPVVFAIDTAHWFVIIAVCSFVQGLFL
jgi:hypothetical protein